MNLIINSRRIHFYKNIYIYISNLANVFRVQIDDCTPKRRGTNAVNIGHLL